jgi:predicted dehydrogenase
MPKLRIGIIGTGGMGASHGERVMNRKDAHVTAVADTAPAALERARQRLFKGRKSAAEYEDWRKMLDGEALDGVIVATPHTQHYEQVKAALEKGLHVLVEKPMTTKAAHAREVAALAEKAGKVLAIAYQRHGHRPYQTARQIVQSGALGKVRFISVLIAQDTGENFTNPKYWRAVPELSGGGHFMDTGSHLQDIIMWISGLRPLEVCAYQGNDGGKVDRLMSVAVRFDQDAMGTFAAVGISPEWREEVSFYCADGVLNLRPDGLSYQKKGDNVILVRRFEGRETSCADNFVDSILGEDQPMAPAVCGVRVAELSEATYASAASGKPVKISSAAG